MFEINFLHDYTDESLLDEIRSVAAGHSGSSLSAKTFAELSGKVSVSTIRRHFGTWRDALSKAGLEHLYSGRIVSEKMKIQPAKRLSDDDIIAELKRVYAILGTNTMNRAQFNAHSVTSYEAVRSRFGWNEALKLAQITPAPTANRKWTVEQCFENLAVVWTHCGRPPAYREMFNPPSIISGKAYEGRWGTWRTALRAFVVWANSDSDLSAPDLAGASPPPLEAIDGPVVKPAAENNRQVGQRMRFRVFQRDRFRCVACGRSPATQLNIILHADHINPVALGGKTVIENLQTLCESCNLGKGVLPG
ncbi:MAG: HNH endonuclease [Acidobacteria bacterium]|nr:HNH endonuclease [Acidobacteriota bacterium]